MFTANRIECNAWNIQNSFSNGGRRSGVTRSIRSTSKSEAYLLQPDSNPVLCEREVSMLIADLHTLCDWEYESTSYSFRPFKPLYSSPSIPHFACDSYAFGGCEEKLFFLQKHLLTLKICRSLNIPLPTVFFWTNDILHTTGI